MTPWSSELRTLKPGDWDGLTALLNRLIVEVGTHNHQLGRIVSDIESEKGTRARVNADLNSKVEKITDEINGNGKIGVKSELAVLRERSDKMEDALADITKEQRIIGNKIAMGVGILGTLQVAIGVVLAIIK